MNIKQKKGGVVNRFVILLMGLLFLFVAGCGTQDGATTDPGTGLVADPSVAVTVATVTMASSLTAGDLLAQGGTTTITATVTGIDSNPIADGTVVLFTTTAGTITGSVPTVSGNAIATFNAASSGGVVAITSTAGDVVSNPLSLTVASGSVASIVIKNIAPARLGLAGSGSNEVGTVIFSVKDGGGNVVSDGTNVEFALNSPTGGGEALSATSASTVGGDVSVALTSGTVPGVATVTASTFNGTATISTEARVTMGYGKADQLHVSIAAEILNVPGNVEFGIENTLTAYVADRYSNPVPAETPVFFASECGIVSLTDGTGAPTNFTNAFGIASAISVTANPTDDLCRMIVWTEGEEAYTDSNGNGAYDTGEPHADIGEPFIDANDNDLFDSAETYFDLDHSGAYSPADTVWDADTFIWTSSVVRWSGRTGLPVISPATFTIASGGSQDFTITAADVNGNPLPAGSTVDISDSCLAGELSGDTSVTIPDAVYAGSGNTTFHVKLSSITTTGGTPSPCTLKVEVSATPNGTTNASAFGTLD